MHCTCIFVARMQRNADVLFKCFSLDLFGVFVYVFKLGSHLYTISYLCPRLRAQLRVLRRDFHTHGVVV